MAKSLSGKTFFSKTSGRKRTRQGQGNNSRPKGDRKLKRGQGK